MEQRLGGVLAGGALGFALAVTIASLATGRPLEIVENLIWVYTSPAPLVNTVLLSVPIAMAAIGLSLSYRARFITIGAEGQIVLGSVAALWATAYSGLEGSAALALALLLPALSGALYALIPFLLRAYAGASEVLTSLMLNLVAVYVTNYLIATYLREGAFVMTRIVPPELRAEWYLGLVMIVAAALSAHLLLTRTRWGLAIEVYGRAPKAAETYGYSARQVMLLVSLLSGGLAGLGGAVAMLSFQHSLTPMSFPPGYGYAGALVAWLSSNNPLAALFASLFFSSLMVFGRSLQAVGVPLSYALAAQALIVLFTLIAVARERQWQ
ncbi:MAG: hypothetical protein NZ902_00655 [Acidilobaceae archaeon]|nr:hypothetical protein [Acidilobaceae archaeon]MCX8165342.1 hypothetical protein [Acidilobaceae archaeon]MDW7973768.1 hypothetical protein [Sulfolobales archaeon]